MKSAILWFSVFVLVLFLAACRQEPIVPTPQAAATELPAPPTTAALATVALEATDTPEQATAAPTDAPPPTATAEAPASPTVEAEATVDPTAEPTAEPTPDDEPVDLSTFAPGQQDTALLAVDGMIIYPVIGTRFEPLVLFVEPDSALDVELLGVAGDDGSDLDNPLITADRAPVGEPEILVLSPEASGEFSLILRAAAGEGGYTAYLYDPTTTAAGMAVQEAGSLAPGASGSFSATSNGARPVLVMVDPTDLSDIAIEVRDSNGAVVTSANFSGPGGVETAFVLPRGTATYTIVVTEAAGGASNFNVAVVTLE